MGTKKIKKKMLNYKDFFGGSLPEEEIEKAEDVSEFAMILDKHEAFLEDQLSDAKSHLNKFRKTLGLDYTI